MGDVAGRAVGHPAAGLREQEVLYRSHGLCGSVAGAVRGSWARRHGPSPAPVGGSGVLSQRGLDTAQRLRSREVPVPEVCGGMDTGNHCLQALLCGGDTPLPASVISHGEKVASEFCCSCGGSSGTTWLWGPAEGKTAQAASASWLCLARWQNEGKRCLPTVQGEGEDQD